VLARRKIKVLRFWEHDIKGDLEGCVTQISKVREREERLAAARASLRVGWKLAKSSGAPPISDKEIDREIAAVRRARIRKNEKKETPCSTR
jgi:hypothetical protein